jgi:H3 lysine-79-specific histone-lysine N-methyltransferase
LVGKKKIGKAKTAAGRRPARGRVGKRGGGAATARNKRRVLQITGLDLLHTQTLLSTSSQTAKLPAAPGCIDQQLTRVTLPGAICHEEIPPMSIIADDGTNIPYSLKVIINCIPGFLTSRF